MQRYVRITAHYYISMLYIYYHPVTEEICGNMQSCKPETLKGVSVYYLAMLFCSSRDV